MVKIYWIMIETLYFSPKTPMLCKKKPGEILRFLVLKVVSISKKCLYQVKIKFAAKYNVIFHQRSTTGQLECYLGWKIGKCCFLNLRNILYSAIIDNFILPKYFLPTYELFRYGKVPKISEGSEDAI